MKIINPKRDKQISNNKFKRFAQSVGRIGLAVGLVTGTGYGAFEGYKYVEKNKAKISDLERKVNKVGTELERAKKASDLPKAYYPDGLYDYDTRLVSDFNQLINVSNSTYKIMKEAVYINDEGREVTKKGIGSGILLNNGRLITASHVLEVDKTYFSVLTEYSGKLKEVKYFLIDDGERYELKHIKTKIGGRDVGSARVIEDDIELVSFNGKIGDYNDLRRGNKMYVVGFGVNTKRARLRDGIYSSIYVEGKTFTYSEGGNPGDSGGPVFAVMDGDLELVGVITAGLRLGFSTADDLTICDIVEPSIK